MEQPLFVRRSLCPEIVFGAEIVEAKEMVVEPVAQESGDAPAEAAADTVVAAAAADDNIVAANIVLGAAAVFDDIVAADIVVTADAVAAHSAGIVVVAADVPDTGAAAAVCIVAGALDLSGQSKLAGYYNYKHIQYFASQC